MEIDPLDVPLPEDDVPLPLQQPRDVKLPPFWTMRPRTWFICVEGRFRICGIIDEQARFDHVMTAIPPEMVSQVLDLIKAAPEDNPYTYFKHQLLTTKQLSNYEKFNHLVKMEPMGSRKPSQLFHDMLEVCPLGMELTLPFHYFFIQQLLPSLRNQLGETKPGDPRSLALCADQLWVIHAASSSTIAAAVKIHACFKYL